MRPLDGIRALRRALRHWTIVLWAQNIILRRQLEDAKSTVFQASFFCPFCGRKSD